MRSKDARNLQPYIVAAVFIVAGTFHFTQTSAYEQIVPPYLPAHRELVLVSGFFEVLGGLGVILPATRKLAAWGLIALLIAVLPANVYMAVDASAFKALPTWALYARLPLQFLIIGWVWSACIKRRP